MSFFSVQSIPLCNNCGVIFFESIQFALEGCFLSGDTGFSSGPHLHFMVWKRQPDLSLTTVPIRFDDHTALGFVPGRGVEYPPACSSSGSGCALGETPPREKATPAAAAKPTRTTVRRDDGACQCPNGAVLHVDLPCQMVCGR